MARRKKSGGGEEGPAWLITFSDLMTLLLTFFVLLVSMSVIDERSKLVVLSSVSSSFGIGSSQFNPKSPEDKLTRVEPGAMMEEDMDSIKDLLWEDTRHDLNFQENRFVQILSINSEVLFAPGTSTLSPGGMTLLDRMLPYLRRIRYPLLVAGHTANRRDEEREKYAVDLNVDKMDSTWPLSLARAHAVYRHLATGGIPPDRLSLEAFGQYRPRFPDRSPEGRLQNRRVDLVLDKRNAPEILQMEKDKTPPAPSRYFQFKGFSFDLDAAPRGAAGGR